MLVEAPLGTVEAESADSIDWLDITWEECGRRALTRQTRGGLTIRVLLKLGVTLKHLDVLYRDSNTVVAVHVEPCEVLVAKPKDVAQAMGLAYRLGDLHLAIEIAGPEMIVPSDGPAQAALDELDIPYRLETRRFQPTYRSSITPITLAENFRQVRT